MGSEPEVYAAGILNVCKFYLESPLACAPGVTGADLKKRVEEIMTGRILARLTTARKLLLASAGIVAVAGPVWIGMVNAPAGRAQAAGERLRFEVATIKPFPGRRGSSGDCRSFPAAAYAWRAPLFATSSLGLRRPSQSGHGRGELDEKRVVPTARQARTLRPRG